MSDRRPPPLRAAPGCPIVSPEILKLDDMTVVNRLVPLLVEV